MNNIVLKHTPSKEQNLINSHPLPLSLDLNKYGEFINNEFIYNGEKKEGTHYISKDNTIIFVHKTQEVGCRKLTVFENNVIKFECIDTFDDNEDVFSRKIGTNLTLFISKSKNKVLYSENIIQCKSIKKEKIDKEKDDAISSFDIETYLDSNKVFRPYACAFARYDNLVKTYYLTDFNDQRDMFKNCISDMLFFNLGTVYVHNLSKFDSFFLHDILKNDDEIYGDYSINNDRKILSIKVKFKDKKSKDCFVFRDSLLLIPEELRKLTKKFEAANEKLYFPHRFVKENNLKYIGIKPDFGYYDYDEDDNDKFKLDNYNKIKYDN